MGEQIEFKSGDESIVGYLATPDKPNGKGVVVLQEWWGLVPHVKDVADRFAREGFTALAPDLYRGESTTHPSDAERMFMALNIDQAGRDLAGAIAALQERGNIKGPVGVVGYCMGGQLAMYAATQNPENVGAAVNYYGVHPNVKPDFSKLKCPIRGFFGAKDDFVPPSAVEELKGAIDSAGGTADFTSYPDAGHAFFNDSRPDAYVEGPANDAWKKTLAFFQEKL